MLKTAIFKVPFGSEVQNRHRRRIEFGDLGEADVIAGADVSTSATGEVSIAQGEEHWS